MSMGVCHDVDGRRTVQMAPTIFCETKTRGGSVDLTYILTVLRKAWWIVILSAAVSAGMAVVVNSISPVKYEAQSQQFVSMTDQSSSIAKILSGSQFTLQRVKSYTQVATSSQVLDPVIRDLGLPTTASTLAGRVEVSNPLDTVLIQISVKDGDPKRAADIANAISTQLANVVDMIERPQGGTTAPVKLSVTQPALPPTAPVSPRKGLNLALGLLVGLALGAGAALLRDQLNTTVKTVNDIQALTGNVPIGRIPLDPTAKSQPLVTADQNSLRAEAFRALRTNLQFAAVDDPPRSIVITSPLPGEGKSTAACNIALTLALNGSRVVLIEADLRMPRVSAYLELDNAAGLTNVLAGQHAVEDVLISYERGALAVLPSGPIPPNPSELLGSKNMAALLAQLSRDFDYVILDSPPVLPVTDAAVLGAIADGVLLFVRHGKTHRVEVERALQALTAANARLLGTALGFIPRRRKQSSYGYGYGYGYGPSTTKTSTSRPGRAARPPAPRDASAHSHDASAHSHDASGPNTVLLGSGADAADGVVTIDLENRTRRVSARRR